MVIEIADQFQWHSDKNAECQKLRGFTFLFASRIWEGRFAEKDDNRKDYGERRIQALGQINGEYYVVVYTWRGGRRHIISARRARLKEALKWMKSS